MLVNSSTQSSNVLLKEQLSDQTKWQMTYISCLVWWKCVSEATSNHFFVKFLKPYMDFCTENHSSNMTEHEQYCIKSCKLQDAGNSRISLLRYQNCLCDNAVTIWPQHFHHRAFKFHLSLVNAFSVLKMALPQKNTAQRSSSLVSWNIFLAHSWHSLPPVSCLLTVVISWYEKPEFVTCRTVITLLYYHAFKARPCPRESDVYTTVYFTLTPTVWSTNTDSSSSKSLHIFKKVFLNETLITLTHLISMTWL